MKRYTLGFLVGLIAAISLLPVHAGTIVDQGPGDTTVQEWTVNAGARYSAKNAEVLVLASAKTAVPTTPLAGRKAIGIQNLGPNRICCTLDGSTPVASATACSLGWQISPVGFASFDAGPKIIVQCIAATADQVTGAATQVLELK
jgi:hypothetical protein